MPSITRTFRLSLLAAALAATPAFAQEAPLQAVAPTEQAESPLGLALSNFAAQRGIALSFDPVLAAGRTAPALSGTFSAEQGFARLLAGTGLRLQALADGSYTLAAADARPAGSTRRTQPLRVGGDRQAFKFAEGVQLDEDYIHAQVAGNRDIGRLLLTNPAARFDNTQLSNFTPGDISPANVSINGAPFYQNAFTVDGMNINNDIDPAGNSSPYKLYAAPGSSQALALDTELLERLEVLDSNIPARYGGFNGGVINAELRRPSDEFSGKFGYTTSRSEWTQYHIADSLKEDYENASSWGDGQPEFRKENWNATLEGRVSDSVSLLGNFTRTRSTIPTYFYSAHLVDSYGTDKETQRQQNDQATLKAVWDVNDRLIVDATVIHAPAENKLFRSNIRGAGVRIVGGGTFANTRATWLTDWGKVEQRLSWSRSEQTRDAENDDYYTWQRSETKDWGTTSLTLEGEFGDVEQTQRRLMYNLDASTDVIEWAGGVHTFTSGLAITRDGYDYRRLSDSSTYTTPVRTSTCTNSAGVLVDACDIGLTSSGWPGQYLSRRTRYAAGQIGFDVENYAAYIDDTMQYGNVAIRPGIRIERDSYMGQTTVSPRLAMNWAPREGTLLTAGANRYYGRSMATWKLRDGMNLLRYNSERRTSLDSGWTVGTQPGNDTYFDLHRIGYQDELMLAWDQQWGNLRSLVKVVNRKAYDQPINVSGRNAGTTPDDTDLTSSYRTWVSTGRGESTNYSLRIDAREPWVLGATSTQLLFSASWLDVKRAVPTYEDESDLFYLNPMIRYDGRYLRYQEKPADNYARPWTTALTAITRIEPLNLQLTNQLRYSTGYRRIYDTGLNEVYNGESIDVWEEMSFAPTITWDMRVHWEQDLGNKGGTVYTNLDITNVLDRSNINGVSSSVGNALYYDIGRQFSLEVGYRF